jgi:hypothetical protein
VPTDAQILAAGTADAPLDYRVPNAQEILLKAVNANFDGSGASGDFLPAIVIESDGGVVIARAIGQAVTAGGSAEVSFFPRVGASSSAATAGPSTEIAYYETSGVASGSHPGTIAYTMSLVSTSSPATFDSSGGYARMNASGAYTGSIFLDYGTTETYSAGGADYRIGFQFTSFPMYTVGGPWKTIPVPAGGLLVADEEVTGKWVVDLNDAPAGPRLCRVFVQAPTVAPAEAPTGYMVLQRDRPLDWTF